MGTVLADHHVLASSHGYATTHASMGLTSEEKQALEVLGFGQTDEAEYLQSISRYPAAFGRRLVSGRYAITRCFTGEPDTAGRQTLKFVTLVVSIDDWLNVVSRALRCTVADESLWNLVGKSTGHVRIDVRSENQVSTDLRDAAVAIVDAVVASGSDQTSLLQDSEFSSHAVMLSVGVLPDDLRARVAWGVRVLSNGYRFDICSASRFADLGGRRRVIQVRQKAEPQSKYACALSHFWLASGKIPYGLSSAGTKTLLATSSESITTRRGNSLHSRLVLTVVGTVAVLVLSVGAAYLVLAQRSSQESSPAADPSEFPVQQSQSIDLSRLDVRQPTPSETEAAQLLLEFEQAGQWSLSDLRQWSLRARSIFHADDVVGFGQAVEQSRLAMVWSDQVLRVSAELDAFVGQIESQHGPQIWLGRVSELRRYEESLLAASHAQIDETFSRLHNDVVGSPLAAIREIIGSNDAIEGFLFGNDLQSESTVSDQLPPTFDESPEVPQDRESQASELPQAVPIEHVRTMLRNKDGKLLTIKELSVWWSLLSVRNRPDRLRHLDWVLEATMLRVDFLNANRSSFDRKYLLEELSILLAELTPKRLGFGSNTLNGKKIEAIRVIALELDKTLKKEAGDE